MTGYRTLGSTTRRDSGNGSIGSSSPGSSILVVVDENDRAVAEYDRRDLRWGGGIASCWFLDDETGRRLGYHSVPAGAPEKNLRTWFRHECERRYGVRFVR